MSGLGIARTCARRRLQSVLSRGGFLIGSLWLAACTGTVEGPGNQPGGASPPANGGSASGGSGNTTPASDPGRVTLHRLNRAEYNNTVRDLLGNASRPADVFPIDDRGSGFDNIADMLNVSPTHLSLYDKAAKALITEALGGDKRATIVICDLNAQGDVCVRDVIKAFAYRAWRRPATEQELDRYVAVVNTPRARGESVEVGLNLALRGMLLSPHFMYRVELDADPRSATPHALSGYEVASRLSYFLWSSTPDDALLSSAAAGTLVGPAQLREQAARMLLDPRAAAITDNFAGQWLHLRAIDSIPPSERADVALLSAMKMETTLMFRDVAFNGKPLTELLSSSYTYVNARLAAHYGLPGVTSNDLVRVELTGNAQRGGLLSHAGFLTLTSHPDRTSPVKRGTWVMDEVMCAQVPAVPGDIDVAVVANAKEQGLTQRQALEKHVINPTCRSCHQLMDPIGFGLENYDEVGSYRTMDVGSVIDSTGKLPTGETFSGAKELASILAKGPDFPRCVAQKLYTYALGRTPVKDAGHLDVPTVDAIVESFVLSGYSWNELITSIVTSPTFLNRRGEPASGAMP